VTISRPSLARASSENPQLGQKSVGTVSKPGHARWASPLPVRAKLKVGVGFRRKTVHLALILHRLGNLDEIPIRIPHVNRPDLKPRAGAHTRPFHDFDFVLRELLHDFLERTVRKKA
jgi:hypothetical protein